MRWAFQMTTYWTIKSYDECRMVFIKISQLLWSWVGLLQLVHFEYQIINSWNCTLLDALKMRALENFYQKITTNFKYLYWIWIFAIRSVFDVTKYDILHNLSWLHRPLSRFFCWLYISNQPRNSTNYIQAGNNPKRV